jgi:hypothetical protein
MCLVQFQNYKYSCSGAGGIRNEWACRVFQVQRSSVRELNLGQYVKFGHYQTFIILLP